MTAFWRAAVRYGSIQADST